MAVQTWRVLFIGVRVVGVFRIHDACGSGRSTGARRMSNGNGWFMLPQAAARYLRPNEGMAIARPSVHGNDALYTSMPVHGKGIDPAGIPWSPASDSNC